MWLIILDSADDVGFLLEPPIAKKDLEWKRRIDYLPICDHGSILVTSRSISEAIKLVERSDVITVGAMDKEGGMLLLEKNLGQEADKKDMIELAEALELIPLAITQAAAYIVQRGRRCSVREYLEKLQKSSKKSILDDAAGDHRRDRDARNSIILT